VPCEEPGRDTLVLWAARAGRRRAGGPPGGVLRFAFYGRVSTEDWQDPVTSLGRQREQAEALVRAHGRVVAEFCDVGESRSVAWGRRPQAAAVIAALADPGREWGAGGAHAAGSTPGLRSAQRMRSGSCASAGSSSPGTRSREPCRPATRPPRPSPGKQANRALGPLPKGGKKETAGRPALAAARARVTTRYARKPCQAGSSAAAPESRGRHPQRDCRARAVSWGAPGRLRQSACRPTGASQR
jgi:hypothetical protein